MKRYAVLGLGRFGTTLALSLTQAGADVIAVDSRRENVEAIADQVPHAVILDVADERALKVQGVPSVDCAVVAIGENFEASVLATISCKNFGIPFVVARGASATQCKVLERIGADLVIQPEEEMARRLARRLAQPTCLSIQELAEGLTAVQIEAPERFFDRTLQDINLRSRYGVTLIAIRRPEGTGSQRKHRLVYPRPDTRIERDDELIIVGEDKDLEVLTAPEEGEA
jgi:trk system potassium uptake protein TrkA